MFPPDDDYVPHTARRLSMDGRPFRPRMSASNTRGNDYSNRQSSFSVEPGVAPVNDNIIPFYGEDLVFRILCPIDKVDRVIGESDGIIELLRDEVGVDIKVSDPVTGSNEQILIISSDEVLQLFFPLLVCIIIYCSQVSNCLSMPFLAEYILGVI